MPKSFTNTRLDNDFKYAILIDIWLNTPCVDVDWVLDNIHQTNLNYAEANDGR